MKQTEKIQLDKFGSCN